MRERSARRTGALVGVVLALAAISVGCATGARSTAGDRPAAGRTASAAAASTPTAPLPAGTLARVGGIQGRIEVVEREGRRLLLIDGVVQGAVRLPLERAAARPLGLSDPMVALLAAGTCGRRSRRALKLPPRRLALVVGLGTGQTAGALRRAGFDVEVVELEPQLIELGRRFFGYRGHAVASDGLEFLRKSDSERYDVVLLDAFSGREVPAHLVSAEALALMRKRLSPVGVLAVRLLDAPTGRQVGQLAQQLDRQAPTFLFGSGVGDEPQNLYFLSGAVRFPRVTGIAAWPVRLDGRFIHAALNKPAVPALDARRTSDPTTREVAVIGYLVTHEREQGAARLALDLPHHEMGMMRYLLSGPVADQLQRHGSAIRAPKEETGAWFRRTALDLLGGASTCGTGQELSPVVVAVRGVARLRSNMPHHGPWPPDGMQRLRPLARGAGTVYDLEVSQVLATFDKPTWVRLLRSSKLRTPLRRAEQLAAAGELTGAAEALAAAVTVIGSSVPAVLASHLLPHQRLELLGRLMREHAAAERAGAARAADPAPRPRNRSVDPLVRAVACDRVWSAAYSDEYSHGTTPYRDLRRALRRCALAGYRRVAGQAAHPQARLAAGRLAYLLDYDGEEDDGPRARTELMRLKKRFAGELPHLDGPPADEQLR